MFRILLVTVTLLVFASCATTTTPAAPAPSPTPPVSLAGTSWTVLAVNGAPVNPSAVPTLEFSAEQVSGTGGCNRYFGGYTLTGANLVIAQLGSTQMACDPAVMDAEQEFLSALQEAATVRLNGADLEILDSPGTVLVAASPAPVATPAPLLGTTWTLTTFIEGEAAGSLLADTTITLVIAADTVSGKACNTYRGQVTQDGSAFAVGPLATTKMACPEDGVMAQEARYLDVLGKVTSMTLNAAGLTLTTPDGQALVYSAE